MSSSDDAGRLDSERAALVRLIVEDCLQRRSSGQKVPDEEVIDSHRDLLPELEVALRQLALVERARARAADAPSSGSSSVAFAAAELPTWFPGYRPLREIHRGGQGVVYEAIQESTHRKVAIKVMKEGPFAGPADKARFDREVQILGQLKHPNIVAIHDSGEVEGRFYYVMDYISGPQLDEYVESRRRTGGVNDGPRLDEALRLFATIADAVNVAHLRGVIHRDLKPGNVRIDADGQPHVLDFGLAKVAAADSDVSLMTMTGQFVGSLPWASPEQAEGASGAIDIRTDVYSLGVILYQMLTGRFPYEVVGNVREVLNRIIEAAPVRPSTVCRQINDEIETIVLKCLQKDRQRRYQSAGELSRDIRHYLAGEPIEAKRDSVGYVLRKQLRRYRVPVALAATFVVLVTVGFGVSLGFWRRAAAARDEASAVNSFLQDMLAAADPENARGREVTVRETLEAAARRLDDGALARQPEAEAAVRDTLAETCMSLGLYKQAEQQFRQAVRLRRAHFGEENATTAESLNGLAWALKEQGEYGEAGRLYEQVLATRRRLFGAEHAAVAETLNGLGQLHYAQRQFDCAEPRLREALAMRQRLPEVEERDVASSLANLGSLLRDTGRLAEAEPLLRDALRIRSRALGEEHPHTLVSLNKLALLLLEMKEYAAARQMFEQALALRRRVLGDDHPHVAVSRTNLGRALYAEGTYDEAAQQFEEALRIRRASFAPGHPKLTESLINLVAVRERQGRLNEAASLGEETLADLPTDDSQRGQVLYLIGKVLLAQGEARAAEPRLREGLAALRQRDNPSVKSVALVESLLGRCLGELGSAAEAEGYLLRSHTALQCELGDHDPETIAALQRIVEFYTRAGNTNEAARYRALLPDAADSGRTNAP